MGLFSKKSAATLTLSPEGPYRATDTVTVTVALDEALDGVTSAKIELGYVNVFRYRWAGKADAPLAQGNDSWLTMGQVGTDHGSDKDGEEWVHVLEEPLVVAAGVLGSGNHQAQVRLPSWAPGSSSKTVQWQVRLHVERSKKDVTAEAPLQVLVAPADPLPELRLIQGQSALNNTLTFEIETEKPCYKPGEEVRGTIAVTPKEFVDRTALVAGWFRWEQTSHPVTKNPGKTIEGFTRPMVTFVKDVQLVQHQRAEFPFALTLPADVDPTTEAVHCSVDWYLQVKVEFSGMTGGIERAEREIVVYTA
jgi:hypothetical protein